MHISHDFLVTTVELLLVLGIMVLVHEFGHFLAAKLCGVRVETFSIGFGPRLVGVRHSGTDYRISALPLGGYVKMAGDAPGEGTSGDPGEFNAHPRWQRAVIALAGPFANFVLTFALLAGLAMFHNEVEAFREGAAVADYVPVHSLPAAAGMRSGDTIVAFDGRQNPTWEDILDDTLTHLNRTVPFSFTHNGQRVDSHLPLTWAGGPDSFDPTKFGLIPQEQATPMQVSPAAGSVSPDLPGAKAGLEPGDVLTSFNGYTPHSIIALVPFLQDQAGQPLTMQVSRNGQPVSLHLTPILAERPDGSKAYQIGFLPMPPPTAVHNLSLGPALAQGARRTAKDAALIVDVLRGMIARRVSVRSVSGPIGIGQQVHQAFVLGGPTPITELMAFISVNLGIFNLLPFPILDGGMILFLIIETVMGHDVNLAIKERVYQVAFVCFVLFAAFVIFNDISRLSLFAKP